MLTSICKLLNFEAIDHYSLRGKHINFYKLSTKFKEQTMTKGM